MRNPYITKPWGLHSVKCIAVVMLAIILCSCSRPTKTESLLGRNPDKVPCWRGICPGQNLSPKEVLSILNKTEGVSEINYDQSHHLIHFIWDDTHSYNTSYNYRVAGIIGFSSDDIDYLTLELYYKIPIGELVDYLGSPECVGVYINPNDDYTTRIDYWSKGIAINLETLESPIKHQLSRDMAIKLITLEITHSSGECIVDNYINTYKWQGFDAIYP